MYVYELYDEICGDTVGFFKTREGALKAMAKAIEKVTPGLCHDYEGDTGTMAHIKLCYSVLITPVQD